MIVGVLNSSLGREKNKDNQTEKLCRIMKLGNYFN